MFSAGITGIVVRAAKNNLPAPYFPPVAQLVERVSYTHVVPGSSPGGWTAMATDTSKYCYLQYIVFMIKPLIYLGKLGGAWYTCSAVGKCWFFVPTLLVANSVL